MGVEGEGGGGGIGKEYCEGKKGRWREKVEEKWEGEEGGRGRMGEVWEI